MGILGYLIVKGTQTAAKNATIAAVGSAAANVLSAASQIHVNKEDSAVKNGVLYIKPTRSSDEYYGKDVSEIVQELLGNGFENISLKPVKKLGQFSAKKYGLISSISIGGNNSFSKSKKMPASSYIVIEYLDFKETVDKAIYGRVERIVPGKVQHTQPAEVKVQLINSTAENCKYCCYCGQPITNAGARFCGSCGKEIL